MFPPRCAGLAPLALLLAMMGAVTSASFAAVVHVPGDAPTIQAGVDLAVGGDHVVLADGTWTGAGNRDVIVAKGVTIRSASGDPALCVVDCQGAGRGFVFQGFASAARLEGITIRNGSAARGGGIWCTGVSPTFERCRILANTATSAGGGGLALESSASPRLVSCQIAGNNVTGANGGGGIWNVGGSPVLINCVISGNKTTGIGIVGGGIHTTSGGTPSLTNCALVGNSAYDGSGIYCSLSSNPTLVNSILWANLPGQSGLAIVQALGAVATVTYSALQGGFAGTGNLAANPVFLDVDGPDGVIGTADDDLRLARFSPCTDAGNSGAPRLAGVTVDAGGQPRFVDDVGVVDTGVGGAPLVDIGPFERQTESVPQVFHVPSEQPTLQAAVDLAAPGDEILLADGIHTGPGNRDVVVDRDVVIRSASGDPVACVLDAQGASRVLSFLGVGPGTRLEAVTIRNGLASQGGGLYLSGASPTLLRCRIVSNTATGTGGGGLYCGAGSAPHLAGCVIRDNVATNTYGGGFYNRDSHPLLTSCVLSGNAATGLGATGGAMYNRTSGPSLINCSVGANTAYDASVMYNFSSSFPELLNCIVWANAPGASGPISNVGGSSTYVAYTDIQGGAAGPGNLQVDPLFLDSDLRIAPTSPCVDAGLDDYVHDLVDVLGAPRIVDGNGDAAAVVDLGAYESPAVGATGSPRPATAAAVLRLSLSPNPSSGGTEAAFALPATGRVSLTVFDISGRRVRTLIEGARAAGAHTVAWDGMNEAGHPVAAGTYLLRLSTDSGRVGRKIVLVR